MVNEYPFEPGITEDAVISKMKSLGYGYKSSKGFDVFKMVKLPELGSETYDLYYKVERKSKKEKDKSVLTLLISTGYENFINDTTGAEVLSRAKKYANELLETIAAYSLEKQIEEQVDAVRKAEKKYNNSVDNGADLEKKKRNIEADIEDNKKDQAAKKAEMESQRQVLETLKSKRTH